MPSPKGDSELVRLIRDLEAKRQARKRSDEILAKLNEDLQATLEYYERERDKLIKQAEATQRDIRVQDAELRNVEELVREQTGREDAGCGSLVPTLNRY